MEIQNYVQAYLTYENKIWLIKNMLVWSPVGGHLARNESRVARKVGDLADPINLLEERIANISGTEKYKLFGEKHQAYLTRLEYSLSPKHNIHINTIYFGKFEEKTKTEDKIKLFELNELPGLNTQNKVYDNSVIALDLSKKF